MAKDITINAQSGDFIVSEDNTLISYWSVIWGKLFTSDEAEYMNIVVPNDYINEVSLKDGEYVCYVKADYNPTDSEFLARFVVKDVTVTGGYSLIQKYASYAPGEAGVEYYPTYTGSPQNIKACQLPMVDADGLFMIIFRQYPNSNFSRATICTAKSMDFSIGDSDSQSAQLLARCAPGKFYRFPTTGLDLTKYINSVVEHTDMVKSLVSQFSSDSKQISEAEFDSSTGDLQVVFSGTKEAEDTDLTDPQLLDVQLLKATDDDLVGMLSSNSQSESVAPTEFVAGLADGSFLGIYDMGSEAELEAANPVSTIEMPNPNGGTEYLATVNLEANRLYAINYDSSIINFEIKSDDNMTLRPTYSHQSLFSIYTKDGTEVYADEPFLSHFENEYRTYAESFKNRRCFIPLQDLTAKFYAGTSQDWLENTGFGIRAIVNDTSNYQSILGLSTHDVTGRLKAIVCAQSSIENVKIDVQTSQILVISKNI